MEVFLYLDLKFHWYKMWVQFISPYLLDQWIHFWTYHFTWRIRANVQSWNRPQRLYIKSQGWKRKNIFNLPQATNKWWTLWPCVGPKAEKRIPLNLGNQFATLGANIPTFIIILKTILVTWGQTTSKKGSKLAPSFFDPDF